MKRVFTLGVVSTLALAGTAEAVDGSWAVDADGAWSSSANWSASLIATGTDARVFFTNAITAPRTVSNDFPSNTIGQIIFTPNAGNGWTVAGEAISLSVSAGSPTISVASASSLISARLLGTQGLTKAGTGTLRLSGNNQYTGVTAVAAGRLSLTGGVLNASVSMTAGTLLSAQLGTGLVGEYYFVAPPNVNNANPNFSTLPQLQTYLGGFNPNLLFNGPPYGTNFDFGAVPSGLNTNFPPNVPSVSFQTRWRGIFNAPSSGDYYFGLVSDDGSMLWIDGAVAVTNNSFQGVGAPKNGVVTLSAGPHEIVAAFYEGTGGYGFYINMALPGDVTNRLPLSLLQTGPAIGSLSGAAGSVVDLTNAPLIVAQSTDQTFAGTLTGGNELRKIGTATLTLTANNSAFTGGLNLGGGRVSIATDNNLGSPTCPIMFVGGALQVTGTVVTTIDAHTVNWSSFNGAFDVAATNNIFTVGGSINGAGTFGKRGAGTLYLTAVSPHYGTLQVSSGIVDVAVGASIASSLVQVDGGGLLVLESSTSLSTNAVVQIASGASGFGKIYLTNGVNQTVNSLYLNGAIQKSGTYGGAGSGATFILANYFSGLGILTVTTGLGATPSDGSWAVNASGDWGVTDNWVNGVIAFGTNATANFTNAITGDRTVNNAYAPLDIGNLYFYPTNTFNWIVTNGTINLAALSTPVITVGSNNTTISSVLAGSQGFNKAGDGQLIISGAASYSSTTTVSQGTVQLTGNGTLYSAGTKAGAIVIKSGGMLALNRSDVLGTHANAPAEPLSIQAGGLVQNSGAFFNTFRNVTLSGGELRANGGANTNFPAYQLKGTVTVVGASASLLSANRSVNAINQIQLGNNAINGTTELNVADVTGDANADLVVSAGFSDGRNAGSTAFTPSGFVKTGPGKLLMSGNNINTGPSSVNAGELVVSGGVVNASVSLSSGAMVSAVYGPGLVGEYYFTGPNTNPVSANFNTFQAFANHQAGLPTFSSVYNGPNNSTNFDFIGGGWPIVIPNNQWYEGRWIGKYIAPSNGLYSFTTSSDDGSMLWIDGTNVVNNNAFQGTATRTGSVSLVAGLHDITILFYQGTGGFTLNASNTLPDGTSALLQLDQLRTAPAIGSLAGVAGGVVNVSNAPITIAQITDTSYGGSFAGTNVVRKIGHGALTLTADNTSFPGVYRLSGGRTAVSADNFLPPNLNFNGGLLRIDGTGMATLSGSHAVNWDTFIGGFDIADPANSFTITTNIGSDLTLSSLWKYGGGQLSMVGNSNVLNLGLNVVSGQVTATSNNAAVNGGVTINNGSLVVNNAYMANISNTVDTIGNIAGDFGTMTLVGTSQYFKTQNSFLIGNANGAKGAMALQDNATLRRTGSLMYVGNVSGSAGALYQTGGSLALGTDFNVPRNAGAYGFFLQSGGTSTNTGNTQNGGGVGLIYHRGGDYSQVGSTIQLGNNVGGSGTGVLWMTGGSITSTVNFTAGAATNTRSEFDLNGGTICASNLLLNNAQNSSAFVNLNGGVLQVNNVFKQNVLGTNSVSFNGGTLQARGTGNLLGSGGTNSPDNIYVYSGGAVLDSGISGAAVVPNLIAPTGNGVASIALTNGGAGYIGAPYVQITGAGTGATAIAQMNLTAGTVTNIVVTGAGVNYVAPVATLVGGGFTSPAGLGTVAVAPNVSGGVTIQGSGSIALLGTNTYAGATVISNGILLVNSTNTIAGTLIIATNIAGIGPTYPLDQAFINWLTGKVASGTSGIIALGTNSANNIDLTMLTNFTLGAAGGSQIYSGKLSSPGTNIFLGGGGGNLIYQPNLVTGTNYFIGQPGGSPVGIVTMSGTNDTYAGGIIVQGGTLRSSRNTNGLGSSATTITVQDGATLDFNGVNLNAVKVFVTGRGVGPIGVLVNNGPDIIPAIQFVTLTGDATFGGSGRWDIRSGTIGPKLDLAGYTMTKTNGNIITAYSTEVTDGNIIIGQGIVRFELSSTATSGVGQITVGPSGNLDFWNFNGNVTRPVIVSGGNVSVGSGTANVGSAVTLNGPTNTFTPANGTTLHATNLISGSGTLLKIGLGTVKLSAAEPFTGPAIVSIGTLELAANDPVNGALGSSSGVLVNNGATIRLDYDYGLFGSNVRPLTIGNGGAITTSNGVGYHLDQPFTLAGGVISGAVPHATLGNWVLGTNVTVTALSSITAPRTQLGVPGGVIFDITSGASLVVSGTLEDPNLGVGATGTLIKTGSGMMTITSTNTYQGATIVASGTLRLAAYSPAGGASIWLDASDDSTITRDGSGLVSQWNDKSGNGRHATQTTAANKPSFITNALLSKTVMRFSGSPQLMNADLSFLANNGYSIFAVEGRTNSGNLYFLGTQGGNVNNQSLHFGYRGDTQFTLAQYANDLNSPAIPAYATQTFHLWDGIFDYANQYLYLDSTNLATRANNVPFLPTIGPGVVGCGYGNQYYQGDLAEILIYNRAVNATERQQIESYLNTKWMGIAPPTLSDLLPVNTAFKLASGATFDLGGVNQTLGSLSDYVGGGIITNSIALPSILSIGVDNTSTTFSGPIRDGAAAIALVKNGTGTQTLHGASTFSAGTSLNSGGLIINGTHSGTGLFVINGGTLGGTGSVAGTILNIGGTIAPGASPGRLTFLGDLQVGAGSLDIELAGTTAASTYDQLIIGGAAVLGGTLNVTTNGGFSPAVSNTFTILTASNGVTGTFGTVSLPTLADTNSGWLLDYQANAVVLSVTGAPPALTGYDFAATGITNGLTGYQDDADGDGYANLLEYVTGGNLTNADTIASMNGTRVGGLLALQFTRTSNSVDTTIVVEGANASTNSANWIGIATNLGGSWGSATNIIETNGPALFNVTAYDTSPATNRFLRLRITRP